MTSPKPYRETTNAPYLDCPRFERCDCNYCLLDPLGDECERAALPGEPRCRLPKTRRMELAARHPDLLPHRGLWPRELAWESLAQAEKDRRQAARDAARPSKERRAELLAAARAARAAARQP